jgi:hypothetical protein
MGITSTPTRIFFRTLIAMFLLHFPTLSLPFAYALPSSLILSPIVAHTLYLRCPYSLPSLPILSTFIAHTLYLRCPYSLPSLPILSTFIAHTLYLRCPYSLPSLPILSTYSSKLITFFPKHSPILSHTLYLLSYTRYLAVVI